MEKIRDYIVKNIKIVIPVIIVVAVAVAVPLVLRTTNARAENREEEEQLEESAQESPSPEPAKEQDPAAPLVPNEREDVRALVATYYNGVILGDAQMLQSAFDELSENDLLRYEKTSEYLEKYSEWELYTKPGAEEGTLLVYSYYKMVFKNHEEEVPGYQTLYVCEDENGGLYIKNEKNFTEEEVEYIKEANTQDDVVLFNNQVNTEYNTLLEDHQDLLRYLDEMTRQVNAAIGVALAEQNIEDEDNQNDPAAQGENPAEGNQGEGAIADQPGEKITVLYGTATTTVNVRSSDSETADKLGKVSEGTKLQVQEELSNGWTKVFFEGKDGYIKSDYLRLEESADTLAVIGSVTATQNINIRAGASEDAERLGVLPGGDSLELYAVENGWCKVNYNGKVAYVKADYVTQ